MKRFYFLFVVLFVVGSANAQNPDDIIEIPDAVLEGLLLNTDPSIGTWTQNSYQQNVTLDTNGDGNIQVSEALQIYYITIPYFNNTPLEITNLEGLESFTNLRGFRIFHNDMPTVDISPISSLKLFTCESCEMETFITGNVNLQELSLNTPNINSLDLSNMPSLRQLILGNVPITILDLSDNALLKYCNVYNSNITTLDLTANLILEDLFLDNNGLTSIDVSNCSMLKKLSIENNALTTLDVSGSPALQQLICKNNLLTVIDITANRLITSLSFDLNPIERLYLKNGTYYLYIFTGNYTPANLEYVCADESSISQYKAILDLYPGGLDYEINSYCSFVPGAYYYTISGQTKLDYNANGCDLEDLVLPNQKFNIINGTQTGNLISNQSGGYSLPVTSGTHTITPILENPNYFNVTPATATVTYPGTSNPFTQNFCITPNGVHPDLELAILPTTPARPGFDAEYKLIIKNKGNIQQSGSVSFIYDDTVLDYIIAEPLFTTQAEGSLTWEFINLEPFETREINITLNVNSPMETPAVNGDDVLTYVATITTEQVDELPLDNTFTLPQVIVNSFDPNDKTCLEGTAITPDMIGKYVHYMIRFENTGTFAAQNIVVKDMIDTAKFDVSSLIALNGSHLYTTRITGNKVEFIFENINLPFDDANNDGYVVFKIKTLPTLALGDSFSNTASIYFDFNFPIVTEPAVTTFAELGIEDFDFNNYFTLYPNPTKGILNISTKQAIGLQTISIYNTLGQLVVSVPNAKGVNNVDVSSLSTGNYFIKVVSDKGTSNAKFVKK